MSLEEALDTPNSMRDALVDALNKKIKREDDYKRALLKKRLF